jgi:hypothetical protein
MWKYVLKTIFHSSISTETQFNIHRLFFWAFNELLVDSHVQAPRLHRRLWSRVLSHFIFILVATNAIKNPNSQPKFTNSSRRLTLTKFSALPPQHALQSAPLYPTDDSIVASHSPTSSPSLLPLCSHSLSPNASNDASLSLPTSPGANAVRGGVTVELVKKLVTRPDPSLSHKCKAPLSFFFPRRCDPLGEGVNRVILSRPSRHHHHCSVLRYR